MSKQPESEIEAFAKLAEAARADGGDPGITVAEFARAQHWSEKRVRILFREWIDSGKILAHRHGIRVGIDGRRSAVPVYLIKHK